jgi:hypothetical protein
MVQVMFEGVVALEKECHATTLEELPSNHEEWRTELDPHCNQRFLGWIFRSFLVPFSTMGKFRVPPREKLDYPYHKCLEGVEAELLMESKD